MLLIKAFHIIFVITWFAGLFYLPRLFVYHAETNDKISLDRFKVMEYRLYYGITWPSGVLTTIFGLLLITYNPGYYLNMGWMHAKLALIFLLWIYHLCSGHYVKIFAKDRNTHTARFYRVFNEVPTLFLIGIVILVVVKPF